MHETGKEMQQDILLEIKNLKTYFFLPEGTVKAVDGADFVVRRGVTVGVVGESGCGKSVTAFSILKLVNKPGQIVEGEILFDRANNGDGPDVVDLAMLRPGSRELRDIRGNDIAMIFQEPMNSLSPVHTIGEQIIEGILAHNAVTKEQARQRAIELLGLVGIPKPEMRIDAYTFLLSGGMRLSALIAAEVGCNPKLIIE
jgi:peptide/nickel transport system ATP-binding protein